MRLPKLKYNAAEIASLTVLLCVAALLAAVLLARSCDRQTTAARPETAATDSISSLIDSKQAVPAVKTEKKTRKAKIHWQ